MTVPLWLGSFSGGREDGGTPGGRRGAHLHVVRPTGPVGVDPDAALATMLQQTDEPAARGAFETVFRAYYPILCEFATRYVDAQDIANEVVSDVFVRVWNRRETLELRTTLRAYLYGAVANAARNRQRDTEREHRRVTRSVADGGDPVWMGARHPTSDALVASADTHDRLWATVEALGDDGQVLLLRWRYALGYDDIGRVLGVSSAAAQRRHSRALARLRAALPDLFRESID